MTRRPTAPVDARRSGRRRPIAGERRSGGRTESATSQPEAPDGVAAGTDVDAATTTSATAGEAKANLKARAKSKANLKANLKARAKSTGRTDAESNGAAGPAAESVEATAKRHAGPRPRTLIVVAVLLVAVLAAVGVLGYRWYAADRTDQARAAAETVAREVTPKVLSYDHRHFADDVAAAKKQMTSKVAGNYNETTAALRPQILENKAIVTAKVRSVGVVSAMQDRVVVVVFADQTTRSNRLEEPRTDQNRVRMTLDRHGAEGWRIGKLEAF